MYKFPTTGEGQETLALQEHSSPQAWQWHRHSGWKPKTSLTVGVCSGSHLSTGLEVLHHSGCNAILTRLLYIFFVPLTNSPFYQVVLEKVLQNFL